MEDGSEICTITGFCIRVLKFSDNEFHQNIGCLYNSKSASHHADADCEDFPEYILQERSKRKRESACTKTAPLQQIATTGKKNRYRSWVHQRIQTGQGPAACCSSSNAMMADEVGSLIEIYIMEILCSTKWLDCMHAEARLPCFVFACVCVHVHVCANTYIAGRR
jgi:hypothetical protein